MLKPSEAVLYASPINEVVSDLIVHLQNEREKSPCGLVVQDVTNQLYRFALEGTCRKVVWEWVGWQVDWMYPAIWMSYVYLVLLLLQITCVGNDVWLHGCQR